MDVTISRLSGSRLAAAGCLLALIAAGSSGCGCDTTQPLADLLPTQGGGIQGVSESGLRALPDSNNDGIPDMFTTPGSTPGAGQGGAGQPGAGQPGSGTDQYQYQYADWDNDGVPNYLDTDITAQLSQDSDGDGVPDFLDPFPFNPDANGDGILDGMQTDSDNDGVPDWWDTEPWNPDEDGDGVLDGQEDADGDGIPDWWALYPGGNPDPNGDGIADCLLIDTDGDGILDSSAANSGQDGFSGSPDGELVGNP